MIKQVTKTEVPFFLQSWPPPMDPPGSYDWFQNQGTVWHHPWEHRPLSEEESRLTDAKQKTHIYTQKCLILTLRQIFCPIHPESKRGAPQGKTSWSQQVPLYILFFFQTLFLIHLTHRIDVFKRMRENVQFVNILLNHAQSPSHLPEVHHLQPAQTCWPSNNLWLLQKDHQGLTATTISWE